MRKRIMALMMAMVLILAMTAGCGKKDAENTEEASSVVGVFMDKKDFMFTIEDSDRNYLGFAVDEKPDGYDELEDGDKVKVVYEGIVTEVDPFEGEIISIEKVE